jgi:CubicO group peptidase (beta-lactamase class C family)
VNWLKFNITKTTLGLLSLVLLVFLASYLYISAQTDTYLGRWFAWKSSDIDDYLLFPEELIENEPPVYNFSPAPSGLDSQLFAYEINGKSRQATLDEIMSQNDTTALIILKDNQLLYEKYFNGYTRDSINTSFSLAKSITSLLVGIALDEGLIENENDPISKYIPELLTTDPQYQQVTIENLLSMTSGIEYQDHDLPWGDKPKAYYHPFLRKHVFGLKVVKTPDDTFQYNTYNPIILGIALERTTGKSVPTYFEEKIWRKLGMEFPASWSLDSAESGMAKMESGINARAIDFAKLGQLVLQKGTWEDNSIVSATWVDLFSLASDKNRVAEYGDTIHYNRGWWLHSDNHGQLVAIAGWGHLGQYLYIFPQEDLVITRFGKSTGTLDSWPDFFLSLAQQL